jgi:sortase A
MDRLLRALERGLLACGSLLLASWLGALVHQRVLVASDLAAWEQGGWAPSAPAPPEPRQAPLADTREWSSSRLAAYLAAPVEEPSERLALLEIPAIDLAVTVLEGTDAWTLNRGVGRIEGTSFPGDPGNTGIAGHRDGFFRALRRVREGDEIRLRLSDGATRAYRVAWLRVVRPEDIWVLEPTDEESLTLVTCHPFRFVGRAPERFVVRAIAANG